MSQGNDASGAPDDAPQLTYEARSGFNQLSIEPTPAGAIVTLPATAVRHLVKGLLTSLAGAALLVVMGIGIWMRIVQQMGRSAGPGAAAIGGGIALLGLLLAYTARHYLIDIRNYRRGTPARIRLLLTAERVWSQPRAGERVIGGVLAVEVIPYGGLAALRGRAANQGRATVRVVTDYSPPLPLAVGVPRPLAERIAAHLRLILRLSPPPQPVVAS